MLKYVVGKLGNVIRIGAVAVSPVLCSRKLMSLGVLRVSCPQSRVEELDIKRGLVFTTSTLPPI